MITNTRSCSCEGTNPDCFRCNGTGMIPLRIAAREDHSDIDEQIKALHGLKVEQQKKAVIQPYVAPRIIDKYSSKYYDVECPFCHKNFHQNVILKHVATSHKNATLPKGPKAKKVLKATGAKNKKSAAKKNTQFELKDFIICDICNVKIMTKRIKRHMERVHSQFQSQSPAAVAVTSKFKLDTLYKFIVCTKCNRHIPQSEYDAHCILHMTGNKSLLSKSRSGSTVNNNAIQITKIDSRSLSVVQGVAIKLDATYGSHVIRDVGRFGSHPSHDNFDDESEA